ncbi:MAG TPA: DNA replication and repair protein RecF [Candidatus Microsaccharimonas sp.]|nr:DNA replication and repair protein RecF [Candidatus Microsaccharimonas sp.]
MIANLRLQNFRSYSDETFEFSPTVNIVVGPNASGKTNLLEAILVLCRGGSYRAKDSELIAFDAPWARLDALVNDEEARTVKLVEEPLPSKSFEFSGKVYKRLNMTHSIPAILFEPNNLQLLHGSPEQRRGYLDELLEQQISNYGTMRRNYRRVLAQRNALLKRAKRPTNEELFPWNLRLSELGAYVARARAQLAETINASLGETYQKLSTNKTAVTLTYSARFPLDSYETQMLKKLEADLPLDVLRGFTAAGPHREDFVVLFDGREASETASRGETRTLVLTLKILELELVEQARGVQPVMLLDDVFSELDGARRHALTDYLKTHQTFITTTDADIALANFGADCNVIPL